MLSKQDRQQNRNWCVALALLLAVLLITGIDVVISCGAIIQGMENNYVADVEFHTEVLYKELGRKLAVLDSYAASFTQGQLDEKSSLLERLEH